MHRDRNGHWQQDYAGESVACAMANWVEYTMDPKEKSKFEQATAEIVPPMIRRMYLNFVNEGFLESQALELVKTYLRAFAGGSIK